MPLNQTEHMGGLAFRSLGINCIGIQVYPVRNPVFFAFCHIKLPFCIILAGIIISISAADNSKFYTGFLYCSPVNLSLKLTDIDPLLCIFGSEKNGL